MNVEASERIDRLEDEQAILDTLYRYAHSIDYHLEADWIDCFTEDGVWETSRGPLAVAGAEEHGARGHVELRRLFAGFGGPPEIVRKHMIAEPRIEIDGDRCRAVSYLFVLSGHPTGSFVRTFGRYRDRLVRGADGRWRFEHRIAEVDGTHPLAEPRSGPDVTQLLAIEAIKQLKARFCILVDEKRWTEWGDLFTEDAQAWFGLPDDERVVDGRDSIVKVVSRMVADVVTVHEVSTPDIEILGPTSAQGTWSTFSITTPSDGDAHGSVHRWRRQEERYELGPDDRWRIRSMRVATLHEEQR